MVDDRRALSRRQVVSWLGAVGAAPLCASAAPARSPSGDLIWGANGHPFTAYPGIPLEQQLDLLKSLGFSQYRVNTRGDGSPAELERLLVMAADRGVTVLPILHPDVDLKADPVATLRSRAYDLGLVMATRFRGRVPVWELSNELESFAIIQPCERRDDGTQYPCEWGPAGGVGPLEYFGPRAAKVIAVLGGLSEGVAAGDPGALRAMGTAGWGHIGFFERLVQQGVQWDITVWHDYPGLNEDFAKILDSYGKPIWLTEFNAKAGDEGTPEENAAALAARIVNYRALRRRYRIEAAFLYELLDEPYWGNHFEAKMGLVGMARASEGWRVGDWKPAGHAVRRALLGN